MTSFRSSRSVSVATVLLSALALITGAWCARAASDPAAAAGGRVIVLGFDGADARTVEALMQKGELPNLKKLAEQGTFAPLGTTNPAESPVAWAALNAGQNPAKTAIPGFVMRDISSEGVPSPKKGFALDAVPVPIGEISGAPIPTWRPLSFGLAIGAAALVVFAIVFGLLLRLKALPTLVIALALAGVGVWGGMALRGYLPATIPVVKNPLKAAPFWEVAARAGVKCKVLDAAQAWDREDVANESVLCGLGVPDAHGSYTSFYVYTTDELWFARDVDDDASSTSSGGNKLRVEERDGSIDAFVYGPNNFWRDEQLIQELAEIKKSRDSQSMGFKEGLRLDERESAIRDALGSTGQGRALTLPLKIVRKGSAATVTMGTASQEVAEGAWSDWYHLAFELNPLLKVHAMARCKIVHMSEPNFEMYVDTLNIDPAAPPFWQPISQPAGFSKEVAKAIGPFETVGWACMTHPFKDDVIDPVTFLEDIEFTTAWRERMTYDGLGKRDWQVFMSCFSETDRTQHMMYQYYDPAHPLYDAQKASQKVKFYGEEIELRDAIPAVYRHVDKIIGKVMAEYLQPGDTLILCADHGFQSFRRQVHLNNWLVKEGYLVLKPGVGRAQSAMLSQYADWNKTRAYSLGLGMIFVNVKGSAPTVGIVDPRDKDALLREIAGKLLAAQDGDTPFVKSAQVIADIHRGAYLSLEADMMVGFAANYRISWASTGGGISLASDGTPNPAVEDNRKNWSGDHVSVDTSLVRGMFFCNRKVEVPKDGIDLLHIAPTALSAAGVAVPAEMDLPPLEFIN
jgi:predicted AlkP superfamily phosphohydrolase/phosphomutase